MSALISALDNNNLFQFGENGHKEYTWSNDIREKICQLNFQLVRTTEANMNSLEKTLKEILVNLFLNVKPLHSLNDNKSILEKDLSRAYLTILYKMVGYTRDIIDGKGEYQLTYIMIYSWYEIEPQLAFFALKSFVQFDDNSVHPYGSWKDIKYFLNYCNTVKNINDPNHPLIQYCCRLVNDQLYFENTNFEFNNFSLVSKWVPREKSNKFGWIYEILACDYFNIYMKTATSDKSKSYAIKKCKTEYRKLLSNLNRKIDTLQIKQCGQEWTHINFNKVTSISLSKQKNAFMNVKKNGDPRFPDNLDRVECATHFSEHIGKAIKGEVQMKGKRVGLNDFTKQALDLISSHNKDANWFQQCALLNSQWLDNGTQNGALGNFIAMVDVSGSMDGDPLHVAVALGIRIAEKSKLGKRVLTFSSSPRWVNLESCDNFYSMVEEVNKSEFGLNTNFYAALNLILDAIIESKLSPEDAQDMVLVILSDMQIDEGDRCNKEALYDTMKNKYEAAGIRVCGKGYKPPHILFWNLRSTDGFPGLSTQPNTSMLSGFSPVLLNQFCNEGLTSLQSLTPWALLEKSLSNERYNILGDKISELFVIN
jgi:hypothetical protein